MLFACYGICNACMAGTLSALFAHGARVVKTAKSAVWVAMCLRSLMWFFVGGVSLLSVLLAMFLPDSVAIALAGFGYCLLALTGVVATWGGAILPRAKRVTRCASKRLPTREAFVTGRMAALPAGHGFSWR